MHLLPRKCMNCSGSATPGGSPPLACLQHEVATDHCQPEDPEGHGAARRWVWQAVVLKRSAATRLAPAMLSKRTDRFHLEGKR